MKFVHIIRIIKIRGTNKLRVPFIEHKTPFLSTNKHSYLNTDYDPLSVKNVTYPNCYAGYDDNNQVKCMKLNNGMRCITGCMKVISSVSIDTYTLFTVPDDFSLSNIKGIPYQKWITVTNISQKKAYNCLFVGNVISVWFTDNERPSVYDYLSIHLIY